MLVIAVCEFCCFCVEMTVAAKPVVIAYWQFETDIVDLVNG